MAQTVRSNLAATIVDKIKTMILSGELAPGQQIRQEEFAQQLGVSRTPLVNALQVLTAEMLVESFPNRGMFVRKISLRELRDAYEYRAAVENLACRLASKRMTAERIDQLRKLFRPFIDGPEFIDIYEYLKADQEFHSLIIKFSGNFILPRMIQLTNIFSMSYQRGLLRMPTITLSEHIALINALEVGDAEKAEQIMQQHLNKTIELLTMRLNNGAS